MLIDAAPASEGLPHGIPSLVMDSPAITGKERDAIASALGLMPKGLTSTEEVFDVVAYVNSTLTDNAQVMASVSTRSGTTNETYGLGRLAASTNGSASYFINDGRGSVTQTLSQQGKPTSWRSYSAFGEVEASSNLGDLPSYGYNAEEQHPRTGLTYMRFRYYEAKTSTFGVQDTYLGNIFSPLTLNRYLYCLANPVNYTDPSGHFGLGLGAAKHIKHLLNPKTQHGGTQINNNSYADDPGQKTINSPYWTPYNPNINARNYNADMNEQQWSFERALASGNFALAAWHKQKAEEMKRRYEEFYCGDAANIGAFNPLSAAYDSLSEREQQHMKLDGAGLLPGIGMVFDGVNVILYLTEGDFTNAGLSGLAFIPFIGEASGIVKAGGKTISLIDKAYSLGELVYYSEKSGRMTRKLGAAGFDIAGTNIKTSEQAADLIANAERTGHALKGDDFHYGGLWLSKEQLSAGQAFTLTGRDQSKKDAILFQVEGGLNGKSGVFEYILEQDGTISHQLFKEGRTVDGRVSTD